LHQVGDLFELNVKLRCQKVKQALRGHRSTMDQQLDVTVHVWLVSQPKTFYSEVINQIVWWWTKCVVKQGDCVEKLCSCKISALVFINTKHTVRIIIDSPSYIRGTYHQGILIWFLVYDWDPNCLHYWGIVV